MTLVDGESEYRPPHFHTLIEIEYRIMKLCIVITNELLPRFFKLLEQGFFVTTTTGCSIKDLLCKQLNIDEEYLDKRIQTLFLDGKPVDKVEKAYLYNDATLALSGAMPGLVGATLRKGGTFADMRNTISYKAEASVNGDGEARVKLKLFNMVLKELGPAFLESGIWIHSHNFSDFISRNIEDLKPACDSVDLNDQKMDVAALAGMNWDDTELFLKVTSEETG
ncbi:MAG: hypothetical protein V3V39_05220 [Desulfobacterales bacterium]